MWYSGRHRALRIVERIMFYLSRKVFVGLGMLN